MILPDTSVWIEFLKNRPPYQQTLTHHLKAGNVCTVGVVFAELLQGARTQAEAARLLNYYNSISTLPESGLAIEAGLISYSRKAHAKGVGLVDLMMVMAARRAGAKIWSRDRALLSMLRKEEKFHAKK